MRELFDIEVIGDSVESAIFVADAAGTVLYLNKANERNIGIPREYVLGKNVFDLQKDAKVGGNYDISVTIRALEQKKAYSAIVCGKKSGEKLLSTAIPIMKEGEMLGIVVSDNNINNAMFSLDSLNVTNSKIASVEEIPILHQQLIEQLNSQNDIDGFVKWTSEEMLQLQRNIAIAAKSDVTVLITGESGTGKEVVANQICKASARAKRPFIRINCAAIPENLLESELFGYEKGAFTGANSSGKLGAFELANHGTLMLDEIGEMPLAFQPKLLRAIQQKTITRVGGTKEIQLDLRIIAATNRDLQKMVNEGRFRQDLYYRINVLPLDIPPLRARGAKDIQHLMDYFLMRNNKRYGKHISLDFDVYHNLAHYGWPGNIRELENMIERWCVIFDDCALITWKQVASHFNIQTEPEAEGNGTRNLEAMMDDYEKSILLWAKEKYSSLREMAVALGMDYSTLCRHGKKLGIDFSRNTSTKKS